jgi:two-component system OmpR family sensor kinase
MTPLSPGPPSQPPPSPGAPGSGRQLSPGRLRQVTELGGRRFTLRTRLLLAFLVPLVIALGLVGGAATATVANELENQLDATLQQSAGRSLRAITPDAGGPPSYPAGYDDMVGPGLGARGQAAGTLVARVVDGQCSDAGVLGQQGDYIRPDSRQRAVLASVPAGEPPRTVHLGDGLGRYRVVADRAPDGDVIVTGLPLSSADLATARLGAVELVVGLAALLAAGLAGYAAIRGSLRPLHRVAATATRVAELPLSSGEVRLAERVPPQDVDTHTEVGRVGNALNRLLDHVETSLAARQASETRVRQFVADASHELRTPLASIRGYSELVRRSRAEVPDDVAHALRRVESEAVRMTGLVDDLLLLARLDAGRDLEAGQVDLVALAVDTVSDAHVAGPDHHWRLDLPPSAVRVPGDAGRLHQVLANLLANVRAHTPPGTTATTRVWTEDGWAVVEVVDDGPGIPPELLGQVFERFARGDSSRTRPDGVGSTGLGLAIVHAVVTAHGGTARVDSGPGHTTFTVRLPGAVQDDPDDAGGDSPGD